jgi:hypothetical protein
MERRYQCPVGWHKQRQTGRKHPIVFGLQLPRKPLGFKGRINGRFARKGRAVRPEGPPTNLGVRSSNLFGRANEIRNLGWFCLLILWAFAYLGYTTRYTIALVAHAKLPATAVVIICTLRAVLPCMGLFLTFSPGVPANQRPPLSQQEHWNEDEKAIRDLSERQFGSLFSR